MKLTIQKRTETAVVARETGNIRFVFYGPKTISK